LFAKCIYAWEVEEIAEKLLFILLGQLSTLENLSGWRLKPSEPFVVHH
jgi:hypothetical protein